MLSDKELEIIRRKLRELEEEPPANSLGKIQSGLNKDRNHRVFWWMAAACLFIGLLTFVGLQVSDLKTKPVSASEVETKVLPGTKEAGSRPGPAGRQADNPGKGNQKASGRNQDFITREPGSGTSAASAASPQTRTKAFRQAGRNYRSKNSLPGQTTPAKAGIRQQADKEIQDKHEPAATGVDPAAAILENKLGLATAPISTKPENADKDDFLQTNIQPDSLAGKPDPAPADSSNKTTGKRWALGVLVAPKYASKVFVPDAHDNIFIAGLNNKNKINPDRKGIELGLQLTRALNSKLDLELGISWLKARENFSYTFSDGSIDTVQFIRVSATSMVVKPVERLETRAFLTSYSYGGAQLGLTYNFWSGSSGKLGVSLSGGGNLLLKSKTSSLVNGQVYPALSAQEEDSLMNKTNYKLALGLAYTRKLGKGFEIRIMPSLSYFLEPVYKSYSPYKLQPYFLNLNFVLIRRLKREL